MSLDLGTLLVQIGVDVGQMDKGLAALQQAIGKLGGTLATAGGQMSNAFAAPTKQLQGFSQLASGILVPTSVALDRVTQSAEQTGAAIAQTGGHAHGAAPKVEGFAGRIGELYTKMNLLFGGMALTAAFTAPFISFMTGAVRESINFETAFMGVRKTVEMSELEFKALEEQFRKISLVLPVTAVELAKIGEIAGQAGITGVTNLTAFTDTMAKLRLTTNMTVEEASTQMAKFANVMGTPLPNLEKVANALVVLGNETATNEAEIMNFTMRLMGAGKMIGLAEDQIFAFGAAMGSVGINVEEGGSAMSRVFVKIQQAAMEGGKHLDLFAKVANTTSAEFKKDFETDAAGAIVKFVEGLGRMNEAKENTISVMKALELQDIRVFRTLINTASAGNLLSDSMNDAAKAITNVDDINKEVNKRLDATSERLKLVKNNFAELQREIGDRVKPALNGMLETIQSLITAFRNATPATQDFLIAIGGLAAVVGPLMIALSGLGAVLLGMKALFVALGIGIYATVGSLAIIILAIAEFAALAVYVLTHWEDTHRHLLGFWGDQKITFLQLLTDMLELWGNFYYKMRSLIASLFGLLTKESGKAAQKYADDVKAQGDAYIASRREMIKAEKDLQKSRDEAAMMKRIATIKSWADDEAESWKVVNEAFDKGEKDKRQSVSATEEEKKKYLDAFETAFKRSEEDMLDDFKDKQTKQLAIYKEIINAELVAMKERHEKEIADKKYALDYAVEQERTAIDILKIGQEAAMQERLDSYKLILREEEIAFKRSQDKRIDDLKDAQEQELQMIRDKFDATLAAIDTDISAQMQAKKAEIERLDTIKKEEDAREQAQRLQDRINESIRETNKLAASVNFGALDLAEKKVEEERKKAGGEVTTELIRAERDLLDIRDGLNSKAYDAYKKHKESLLKTDKNAQAATKAVYDKALSEVYDAMEKSANNTKQLEKEVAKDREEESRNLLKNRLRDEIDALRDSLQNQKEFLNNAERLELEAAKKRQADDMEQKRQEVENNVRFNKDILDKRLELKKNELKIDGEQYEERRNLRMLDFQKRLNDELEQIEKLHKQEEENEQKRVKTVEDAFKKEQDKQTTRYQRQIEDLHTTLEGRLGEQQSFLDDWNQMADTIKAMEPEIAPITGYDDAIEKARDAVSLFKGLDEAVRQAGSALSNFNNRPAPTAPIAPIAPTTPALPAPNPATPYWPFPTTGPVAPNMPLMPPTAPSLWIAPPEIEKGGTVGNNLTLNVNGTGDPEAVASSVVRILRREGLTFS